MFKKTVLQILMIAILSTTIFAQEPIHHEPVKIDKEMALYIMLQSFDLITTAYPLVHNIPIEEKNPLYSNIDNVEGFILAKLIMMGITYYKLKKLEKKDPNKYKWALMIINISYVVIVANNIYQLNK